MASQENLAKGIGASIRGWTRFGAFVVLILLGVPFLLGLRAIDKKRSERFPRFFHGIVTKVIGFRVRMHGAMVPEESGPVLFVSNHSSYADIPVLGSLIQGCFVAKSEVAGWPVIGGLARLQNTVFVERRSSRAAEHRNILRDYLEDGKSLIVFPEGTSSDGMRTLPFKSTLFSIVEHPLANGHKVKIQPVTVLCTEIGGLPMGRSWRPYYAWYGDMTLIKHAWDLFKISDFTIDVLFHPAVSLDDFGNRKLLADYCQRTIADGVDQCVTGRFNKVLAASN